jgi:F420 biosynthesis protein FbiB-like protein
MGERWRANLLADGLAPEIIEQRLAVSHARISLAPLAVIACATTAGMDIYPDATRQSYELLMAIQSVAMAVQNLLLAAHATGLGACWLCAPLFCQDVVRQTLELPDEWHPQALITLGFPAGAARSAERVPLDSRVLFR